MNVQINNNSLQLMTGEVVLTKGYNLDATYVIHTVGPIWDGGNSDEETLLGYCYQNTLKLAMDKAIKSIALPSISTGVYRFPIDLASMIALQTIINFLEKHSFGEVIMTLFSSKVLKVYKQSLERITGN